MKIEHVHGPLNWCCETAESLLAGFSEPEIAALRTQLSEMGPAQWQAWMAENRDAARDLVWPTKRQIPAGTAPRLRLLAWIWLGQIHAMLETLQTVHFDGPPPTARHWLTVAEALYYRAARHEQRLESWPFADPPPFA